MTFEYRIEHQLLGCDQFVHVRLHAFVERGRTLRMSQAALHRLDISLLIRGKERRQRVTKVVKPEPVCLIPLFVPVMQRERVQLPGEALRAQFQHPPGVALSSRAKKMPAETRPPLTQVGIGA